MTGKFISFIVSIALIFCSTFGIKTGASLVKSSDEPSLSPGDKWQLIFEDNFDGDKLDTTKWQYSYDKESVRRAAYWVDDAVFVKDGNLTIRTDWREDGKFGPAWYTGAISTTNNSYDGDTGDENFNTFSATYGYYEVRCKVPKAYGTWAAFWLMPDNNFKGDISGTGEDGAEIDIFESPFMYTPFMKNSVSHAVHIDGYGDNLKSLGSNMMYVKSLYEDYHTYALEWNENEYIFYVDGTETWRTNDKAGTVSKVNEYLILSVEVGGNEIDGKLVPGKEKNENGEIVDFWSGNADKNDKSENYDFIVDYVKVYQQK